MTVEDKKVERIAKLVSQAMCACRDESWHQQCLAGARAVIADKAKRAAK